MIGKHLGSGGIISTGIIPCARMVGNWHFEPRPTDPRSSSTVPTACLDLAGSCTLISFKITIHKLIPNSSNYTMMFDCRPNEVEHMTVFTRHWSNEELLHPENPCEGPDGCDHDLRVFSMLLIQSKKYIHKCSPFGEVHCKILRFYTR